MIGKKTQLTEATLIQWEWKTPAMRDMAVAVVKLALNADEFSANDLPEFNHGGQGICGAIFRRLLQQGIIARVGHFAGQEFYPKIVSNAGGNKVSVYRLANAGLARALLKAHGAPLPEYQQQELAAA